MILGLRKVSVSHRYHLLLYLLIFMYICITYISHICYIDIGIECSKENSTTCKMAGETCVDGLCKCGQANSCESRKTGSYCDPVRSECRCSEKLESCSDPSRGIFCDTEANSCNCSETASTCYGNEFCVRGSCIGDVLSVL